MKGCSRHCNSVRQPVTVPYLHLHMGPGDTVASNVGGGVYEANWLPSQLSTLMA
jgi:hypothetical protein